MGYSGLTFAEKIELSAAAGYHAAYQPGVANAWTMLNDEQKKPHLDRAREVWGNPNSSKRHLPTIQVFNQTVRMFRTMLEGGVT